MGNCVAVTANQFFQPSANTDPATSVRLHSYNSYFARTIPDWNVLDVDPLQFQSGNSFKHHLNSVQPDCSALSSLLIIYCACPWLRPHCHWNKEIHVDLPRKGSMGICTCQCPYQRHWNFESTVEAWNAYDTTKTNTNPALVYFHHTPYLRRYSKAL